MSLIKKLRNAVCVRRSDIEKSVNETMCGANYKLKNVRTGVQPFVELYYQDGPTKQHVLDQLKRKFPTMQVELSRDYTDQTFVSTLFDVLEDLPIFVRTKDGGYSHVNIISLIYQYLEDFSFKSAKV